MDCRTMLVTAGVLVASRRSHVTRRPAPRRRAFPRTPKPSAAVLGGIARRNAL